MTINTVENKYCNSCNTVHPHTCENNFGLGTVTIICAICKKVSSPPSVRPIAKKPRKSDSLPVTV